MDVIILSIETSGHNCSIGLSKNKNMLSQYSLNIPNSHDELAAELIRRTLNDCRVNVDDLSAIAISSGPGSFTGLRIGASLAKGLCFSIEDNAEKPKLIAVSTLKSFIYNANRYKKILKFEKLISVIPAQKDVIYYQEYSSGRYSEIFMGDILDLEQEKYNSHLKIGPFYSNNKDYDFLNNYSAEKIAFLAYQQYLENDFVEPDKYTPDYIQEFVVKTKRKGLII